MSGTGSRSGTRSPSKTPPRIREPSRGRSRTWRGGEIVVREVVRDSGAAGGGAMHLPMLTRTNYNEWAILMRV